MKKIKLIILALLIIQLKSSGQCNPGLNLGTVVVPTHGNAINNGNFGNTSAWQQASNYINTFNLDYRQRYVTWTDVVSQITANVPTYTFNTNFENILATSAGSPDVHIVYPIIQVGVANQLVPSPSGAATFTTFLDTGYISQNYKAVKHVLSNVANVKWISLGNEIETYFGGAYLNTGRLTKYAQFLSIMKAKINIDFPNVKVGTILAFHTINFNNELNMIDSVLNSVDFIGYTFYYTDINGNCWDSPSTVKNWLDLAKTKSGAKKLMLTETCMGEGGGTNQNCGSPSKQLAYADTLLRWYKNNISNVEGMTWFTVTDPYLGWQTPSTLWNTGGLVDSNGVTIQPAGTLWQHQCATGINESNKDDFTFGLFPNPFTSYVHLKLSEQFSKNENRVFVYNVLGAEILSFNFKSNNCTIDMRNYPDGIYYFKFENNGRTKTQKAILNR